MQLEWRHADTCVAGAITALSSIRWKVGRDHTHPHTYTRGDVWIYNEYKKYKSDQNYVTCFHCRNHITFGCIYSSRCLKRQSQSDVKALFTEIDNEIKFYVKGEMQDPDEKKNDLKVKYADKFEQIVSKISQKHNLKFTTKDKDGLKDLIIKEHMNEIKRQDMVNSIPNDAITETIEIGDLSVQGGFILPTAYATGNPYPINSWKQVTVDINGGSGTDSAGNSYNINAGNQLSVLRTTYTASQVTYTLTFADEDHPDPNWDIFWDNWRQIQYARTTDIESFTVDSDGVVFADIWDKDKTFAEFWGQHGEKTRSYHSGVSIYISNVWNHAMYTSNENSDMPITTWTA